MKYLLRHIQKQGENGVRPSHTVFATSLDIG
jgi:hypothetical protein